MPAPPSTATTGTCSAVAGRQRVTAQHTQIIVRRPAHPGWHCPVMLCSSKVVCEPMSQFRRLVSLRLAASSGRFAWRAVSSVLLGQHSHFTPQGLPSSMASDSPQLFQVYRGKVGDASKRRYTGPTSEFLLSMWTGGQHHSLWRLCRNRGVPEARSVPILRCSPTLAASIVSNHISANLDFLLLMPVPNYLFP